ncbi:MAG: head-tail adaptor protein [Dysosmobacter sp.]
MEKISAGDLRSRVEVLRRVKAENALGEEYYTYETERKVWARIVPTTGRRESLEGDVERAEITHRVTVRRSAIPELQTDLRLRFREQDYDVQYFYPNYRDGGFVDIFVKLVVEDGVPSF